MKDFNLAIYILEKFNFEEDLLVSLSSLFDEKIWKQVCKSQRLSDEFISKFHHKLQWSDLSLYQTLSESTMSIFSEKVNWRIASCHQKISKDFILKNLDKIYPLSLIENEKVDQEELKREGIYELLSIVKKLS